MKITQIMPVFDAPDLEGTRDFYVGLLGLELSAQEGTFMAFSSRTTPSASFLVNDEAYPGLPAGFAIDVDDPDAMGALYEEVQRRGMTVLEPLSDMPWGVRRFTIRDPNGMRLTIVSDLPQSDGEDLPAH